MGMLEYTSYIVPGLTSIKNASVASYSYCASQVWENIPDQDRRAQIGSFTAKFAKNAALYGFHEGYKLIPGGKAVGKIVSMTANDMKAENRQSDRETMVSSRENRKPEDVERVLMMKENGAMKSTLENSPVADSVVDRKPKNVERVFMMKENGTMKSTPDNSPTADSIVDRKPEDVLRVFMMKEFIGTRFLDDLIVPGAMKSK